MEGLASINHYLRFVATLTAVVDPFLAVPFFLAFSATRTQPQRASLALVVALAVFSVLAGAVLFGEAVLSAVGASLPSFRVGGGLVLLLMSLAMLNAQVGSLRQSNAEARELEAGEVSGVVPLAIPLLAGPGAISTAIIAVERGSLAHQAVIIVCIALVCLLCWVTLRLAHRIASRLGINGISIATRVLGLLLAAMAVQTMSEGLKQLFPVLAHG